MEWAKTPLTLALSPHPMRSEGICGHVVGGAGLLPSGRAVSLSPSEGERVRVRGCLLVTIRAKEFLDRRFFRSEHRQRMWPTLIFAVLVVLVVLHAGWRERAYRRQRA